jgi:hypothetical protein
MPTYSKKPQHLQQDDSLINLYTNSEFSGVSLPVAVGTDIPDFGPSGMDREISCISVPAQCTVRLFQNLKYAYSAQVNDSAGSSSFLYIHNGWKTPMKIDFTKGNIGNLI